MTLSFLFFKIFPTGTRGHVPKGTGKEKLLFMHVVLSSPSVKILHKWQCILEQKNMNSQLRETEKLAFTNKRKKRLEERR